MFRRTIIIALISIFMCHSTHAEILDRIAAVVNGHVITLSDIRRERAILPVLGDPVGSDEEILKSLVDRFLLEEQIAQFPGLEISDEEINSRMSAIGDLHAVSPAEVKTAVANKIQRRRYFDLRYRQFILVSGEEIGNYYETRFVPEVRKRGMPVPDLDQVLDSIRENVFEEKLSEEVEKALKALRSRSNIEIFQ